ncbi:MAG: SOS response-associated peptidase, partial [Phycisphaerae bacterium]|nr:SOS response-associated peptidase [Phycisphaerae bacterium]
FKSRRCLIPADGFYEWKKNGKIRQTYYFSLKDKSPLAMAGL